MIFNKAKMLIPKKNVNMSKWSVVACDQYTSEPEYWLNVEKTVGNEPSAYNLVLPEVYLDNADVDERIEKINKTMQKYLDEGVFFKTPECYIYIERTLKDGRIRRGVVGCVDLEDYDYEKNSKSKIRATEKTVAQRIPPRLKVRLNAVVELPHIMLLLDDAKKNIIENLSQKKDEFEKIYDFDLMMNSGHVAGYILNDDAAAEFEAAISALGDVASFNQKYKVNEENPLIFAVGDGNHSLATAKEYYNAVKQQIGEEKAKTSPARYALAELVNLHDDSLVFEAIHRVVFDVDEKKFTEGLKKLCTNEGKQRFELVTKSGREHLAFLNPSSNIMVGSVQKYIDDYIDKNGGRVDYIHGDDVVNSLVKNGCVGIILESMSKEDLFPSVIKDGSLPRKTFSMGDACDKRFYIESRIINDN